MPCRCDGYEEAPAPTVLKATYDKAVGELHRTTRLLCEVMETREKHRFPTSIELDAWWEKHQKADAKRLKREAVEKELRAAEQKAEKLKKQLSDLE